MADPDPAISDPDRRTAPEPLRYRVLTGPDDRTFCERVSAALDEGYELHGPPALTYDGSRVVVAQALVLSPAARRPGSGVQAVPV